MPNKKRQKKMADNLTIAPINGSEEVIEDAAAGIKSSEEVIEDAAAGIKSEQDEKVEVLIKEIIRIRPQDFQAFKHALEHFVKEWD